MKEKREKLAVEWADFSGIYKKGQFYSSPTAAFRFVLWNLPSFSLDNITGLVFYFFFPLKIVLRLIQIHFQFLKVQSSLNQTFSLMHNNYYQISSHLTFGVGNCDLFCCLFHILLNKKNNS